MSEGPLVVPRGCYTLCSPKQTKYLQYCSKGEFMKQILAARQKQTDADSLYMLPTVLKVCSWELEMLHFEQSICVSSLIDAALSGVN